MGILSSPGSIPSARLHSGTLDSSQPLTQLHLELFCLLSATLLPGFSGLTWFRDVSVKEVLLPTRSYDEGMIFPAEKARNREWK